MASSKPFRPQPDFTALYGHDPKSSLRFCLLTLSKNENRGNADVVFVFLAKTLEESRAPERRFTLNTNQILKLNPKTGTAPVFLCSKDALITSLVYSRFPIVKDECLSTDDSWSVETRQGLFNMGSHKQLFYKHFEPHFLPLYEAKMTEWLDHRASMYNDSDVLEGVDNRHKENPLLTNSPRYWVTSESVHKQIGKRFHGGWLLGWHRITDTNTMSRSVIPVVLPVSGVADGIGLVFSIHALLPIFAAMMSSAIFDYIARQKIGGTHLDQYHFEQLPIILPKYFMETASWNMGLDCSKCLALRICELVYVSWDLQHFAKNLNYYGPPFKWDNERRFILRCELDAAFFHLYLPATPDGDWEQAEGETNEELARLKGAFPTPRHAVDYVMETFPIVKRKDVKAHGHYRTKDTILEIYDAMTEAMRTGLPYQTRLDPPPGPPMDENGDFIPMERWDRDAWPSHIHPPREEARPKRTRPLSRDDLPYLDYFESERTAWAFLLFPHFVRLYPGLSFDDYVIMALFATTPELGRDLLQDAEQRLLQQALEAAGLHGLPSGDTIKKNIVQDLLQRNGLQIDIKTRTCHLIHDFNLRDVPEVEAIAHYAYLILDRDRASRENSIGKEKSKTMHKEIDRLLKAS